MSILVNKNTLESLSDTFNIALFFMRSEHGK